MSTMPLREEPLIAFSAVLRKLIVGRKTVLIATLAGTVLAAIVAFVIPPEYTAKVSFIPPSSVSNSNSAVLMGQLSQLSGLGSAGLMGGLKNPGDLYAGILRSRSIADRIIDRFDLKSVYRVKKESQAEKKLSKRTAVEVGLKDSIVTLSVTDKSPVRARDIAGAYLDILRETNGRLALSESSQRRLFFEQQLEKEKDALADAEVDLKKTEEQSGLIAPERQTASEIQIIAQTRAEISARKVQLAALSQSATPQNTMVIRLQNEIANLESQLDRLLKGANENSNGAIPTAKVPALELEYVRKLREVKYHEALFEILSKQYEAARMDEARDAPVLQVLDPPAVPDSKSSPWRGLITALGFILGLIAGIAWVLLGSSFHLIYVSVFRVPVAAVSKSYTK